MGPEWTEVGERTGPYLYNPAALTAAQPTCEGGGIQKQLSRNGLYLQLAHLKKKKNQRKCTEGISRAPALVSREYAFFSSLPTFADAK